MGRRLAFDRAKGRLWVICTHCSRWNLTPLEERWEAIDACEKAYHDTPKRVATEQIGLAKVDDGLALVRIGSPVFPEYASWRYGERFVQRRRRHLVMAGLGAAGAVGVIIAGPILAKALLGIGGGSWYWMYNVYSAQRKQARLRRPLGRITTPDGEIVVKGKHAEQAHLLAGGGKPLRIGIPPEKKGHTDMLFAGDHARDFLRLALPHVNRAGSTAAEVAEGVQALDLANGHPDPLLSAQKILAGAGFAYSRLADLPRTLSVGFEMSVMEAQERAWMETHLSLLLVAWKEADELASTADDLTLPGWIGHKVEELRKGNAKG